MKFDLKFVVITLIVALIVVPISFNYLFMWDSGSARGETSDWFTLYGNIFGGLTGGFFTYLAVLLTLRHDKQSKEKETAPQLDILHKNVELRENIVENESSNIIVEITNIGGSLAKNIECTLIIPELEDFVELVKKENIDNIIIHKFPFSESTGSSWTLVENSAQTNNPFELEVIHSKYSSKFVGHCMPLKLDQNAKVEYIIDSSVIIWLQSLLGASQKAYLNKNNELLKLHLAIKYSTEESKEVEDTFELYWDFVTIDYDEKIDGVLFKYILRSKKIDK